MDSSVLISLAKINALSVLGNYSGKLYCPTEIYEEVIEAGTVNKYSDACQIHDEVFKLGLVRIRETKSKMKIRGISDGDSSVLVLAKEYKAVIFTDDIRLRKKSDEVGLVNLNTPEILISILEYVQYEDSLKLLVKNNRLSVPALKYYLEVKKQWEIKSK